MLGNRDELGSQIEYILHATKRWKIGFQNPLAQNQPSTTQVALTDEWEKIQPKKYHFIKKKETRESVKHHSFLLYSSKTHEKNSLMTNKLACDELKSQ